MAESTVRMFAYTAVSNTGLRISDKMAASSIEEVVDALIRAGYAPLSVNPTGGLSLDGVFGRIREALLRKSPKMKRSELSAFTSQLHQLLKAGIAMPQAVATLAEGQKPEIAEMLRTISDRMVSGISVSEAFSGYPKCFDAVFCAYMAAGEQTGNMSETTFRLSRIVAKRAAIHRKIVEVSFYPIMVSSFIFIMLGGIIVFLVPRYASIYQSFGSELPGPTQLVVSISRVFPIIVLVVGALVAAFIAFNRSRRDDLEFGTRLDRLRFRLPLFGRLWRLLALYRWSSTVGGAAAAGVAPHMALQLAGQASASRWVRKVTVSMQEALTQGRPLSSELARHPDLFPPTVLKMVLTGEDTGELADMLNNVADSLENEIDLIVATMGAKLEVVLLMFMAISVGSILIALYLPILNLTDTIGNKINP